MAEGANATRTAGRPTTTVLSSDIIIDAAFALAEKRGAGFSLASLARSLGVQPSALAYYFATKDDLIAGMRGHLSRRIGAHDFESAPWWEAIVPWAHAYREAMGAHPGVIAEMAVHPIDDEPESIAEYEQIIAAMVRDNYPRHLALPALVALESYIIGSALDALTPESNMEPVSESERSPNLLQANIRARTAARARGMFLQDLSFDVGLKAMIVGLRSRAEEERT